MDKRYMILGTWDNGDSFQEQPIIVVGEAGVETIYRLHVQHGIARATDSCFSFFVQVIDLDDGRYNRKAFYKRGVHGAFIDASPRQ